MQTVYTIGITGGSGSGKTYFLQSLASRFTADEICFISQDNYYKSIDQQIIDANGVQNFDLPTAIQREKFHDHIQQLQRGETVSIKEYMFNNVSATPKILTFKPAPLLIVEGLFVQYFEEISSLLDLKVFIEAKDYIKLSRRIRRDNDERGYDFHDVIYRFEHHVMPVYESIIKPLKHNADLIIPNNQNFEKALDLLALGLRSKLTRQTT
jgi:uridine kinase